MKIISLPVLQIIEATHDLGHSASKPVALPAVLQEIACQMQKRVAVGGAVILGGDRSAQLAGFRLAHPITRPINAPACSHLFRIVMGVVENPS